MTLRLAVAAMVTLLAPVAHAQPRASSLPPLPALELHAFPPEAREAIEAAARAARAAPNQAGTVGTLARTLQAWEQWDAAHEAYSRARALAPRTFDWAYLDGIVLQRLARPLDAVPLFESAVALVPSSLAARTKLAEALFDAGRVEASAPIYAALARDTATAPIGELGLGRIAALDGRQEAAIDHFERAIALFPSFGAAHYGVARAYRAVGRADDAKRALARHAELGPQWPAVDDPVLATVSTLRIDARAEATRGLRLAAQGDLAGAIAATEAALARDATLVQARANLISLYGRSKDWARAEASYRAVVAAGLHLDEAHYNYGVVLGLQSRWAEAEQAYRAAVAVNPLHASARNNLGQILERAGQVADAEREYRAACDAQPTFRLGRFNLARTLIALGRPDAAIIELDALRTPVDAETPRYVFALGVAHMRAGRREEGLMLVRDARALAERYSQAELVQAIDRNLAEIGAR